MSAPPMEGPPPNNFQEEDNPPYTPYPQPFDIGHYSQSQPPPFPFPQPSHAMCADPSASQNVLWPPAVPNLEAGSYDPMETVPSKPTSKSNRKASSARCGGASSRGPSYTVDEDKILCSAWLNVNQCSIVGTNQTSDTYWERITTYFNANSKNGPTRTSSSLESRWQTISKDTSRFCSMKAEIDRRRESGKTEDDRENDALELFHGRLNRPFLFLQCWKLLRNTRKWEDWISRKDTEPASQRAAGTAAGLTEHASVDAPADDLPRPIGRDKAKKRRADGSQPSESSAALELFQQMANSRELKMQQDLAWATKQDQYQERQLALQEANTRIKEEQTRIQQEQTRIQQEDARIRREQWEEEARLRREQWERAKLREDNEIMMMDVSNCSDVAREYLRLQREILNSRFQGGGSSGNNN